mmetsp:Transcript_50707/g.147615  ORF Transcript_50707/g.147615 Transcript_50707/m.147615 type:complete len:329 (+) Transcript_50707:3422-4408(+)
MVSASGPSLSKSAQRIWKVPSSFSVSIVAGYHWPFLKSALMASPGRKATASSSSSMSPPAAFHRFAVALVSQVSQSAVLVNMVSISCSAAWALVSSAGVPGATPAAGAWAEVLRSSAGVLGTAPAPIGVSGIGPRRNSAGVPGPGPTGVDGARSLPDFDDGTNAAPAPIGVAGATPGASSAGASACPPAVVFGTAPFWSSAGVPGDTLPASAGVVGARRLPGEPGEVASAMAEAFLRLFAAPGVPGALPLANSAGVDGAPATVAVTSFATEVSAIIAPALALGALRLRSGTAASAEPASEVKKVPSATAVPPEIAASKRKASSAFDPT